MTRRLHLWDEADLDVLDAVAWYEDQRAGLGAEFLIELDGVMQRIVQTPFQLPGIKENVRRALLQRFPYSVYFQVGDETVGVLSVLVKFRNSKFEIRIFFCLLAPGLLPSYNPPASI